MDWR